MKTFEERIALLQRTYDAFNRRQIDEVLSVLDPEVSWPNMLERRFIRGHRAVREYWEGQFQLINSHVEPTHFTPHGSMVIVDVRQVVRDLRTDQVGEQHVTHAYTFRGDLIARMQVYETLEEALAELRCESSSAT
ncbi:MAG TPA: nuclear transport factor 2 family protein [Myxococcota bacterium]|nr:nuclear transport factor 2 family protein [Myxococcota bacterium]